MDVIDKLIEAGRVLWEEGLVTSHGGNLSVRQGDSVFITRTGTKLGFLKKTDFVKVPIGVNKFDAASSELIVHMAIYEHTTFKAVVHAHPKSAVALSFSLKEIVPLDFEGKLIFERCPVIDVSIPHASSELAGAVVECMKNGNRIVCVKGHGTFAASDNLEEALFLTSSLEFSACLLILNSKL